MKHILYGDAEHEPNQELCNVLVTELFAADTVPVMIEELARIEFEARKDVSQIFNNVLRRSVNGKPIAVDFILANPTIVESLIVGYEDPEVSLHCGSMLRECVRQEALARMILNSPSFYTFFQYVESSNFDVASDAFVTLKVCFFFKKTKN
jgi:calcium binding protein 39